MNNTLTYQAKVVYPTGEYISHNFLIYADFEEESDLLARLRFDTNDIDEFLDETGYVIEEFSDDPDLQDQILDFFENLDIDEYITDKLNDLGIYVKRTTSTELQNIIDKSDKLRVM